MSVKTIFSCQKCGAQSLKWAGRCLECGGWGTFTEEFKSQKSKVKSDAGAAMLRVIPSERRRIEGSLLSLNAIQSTKSHRLPTGIGEVDRVLGGGIPLGAVILLAGEPGIGKSTLVAQISSVIARSEATKQSLSFPRRRESTGMDPRVKPEDDTTGSVLYVSGEESPEQLKQRFDRLQPTTYNLQPIHVLSDTTAEVIAQTIETIRPSLAIVDSVQTLTADIVENAGALTRLQASTAILAHAAKKTNVPVILIGQVTKSLDIAGPKSLEHLVDIILTFEGDHYGAYRLLRAAKNRFGSTDEIGVFSMNDGGLAEVPNPSASFLESRSKSAGSVVTCVLEGTRPILVEIQALVNRSRLPYPERRAAGFDVNRLNLLLAVLQKLGLPMNSCDVHINVTSGFRVREPAADLAVVLAVASSLKNKPIPQSLVAFGEVGLGGELRPVRESRRRVQEVLKMNFTDCLLPKERGLRAAKELHSFVHVSETFDFLE